MNYQRTLTILGIIAALVTAGTVVVSLAGDSASAVKRSKNTKRVVGKVIRGVDQLRQAQEYERKSRKRLERRVDGHHVRPKVEGK